MEIDNVKTLIENVKTSQPPFAIAPTGKEAPIFILPQNYRAEIPDLFRVEQWLGHPVWKRGSFYFGTVDSFIRYFNEHKTPDSRIFARVKEDGADFCGWINFHGTKPSFNDHQCHHSLKCTHEWKEWMENNRKNMTQAEFAGFLEENENLFVDPSGANLLELVQTLEAKQHVHYDSGIKLKNSTIKLRYSEEVELRGAMAGTQTGDMELPAILAASIAPFEGTGNFTVKARLKYRLDSRKITFWYETVAPHLIVRQVVKQVLDAIEQGTNVPPFIA